MALHFSHTCTSPPVALNRTALVPQGHISEDSRSFQYLSFYQKEMALYLYHNLERQFRHMCLDAELPPLFKVRGGSGGLEGRSRREGGGRA